jgi:hypothetical protein
VSVIKSGREVNSPVAVGRRQEGQVWANHSLVIICHKIGEQVLIPPLDVGTGTETLSTVKLPPLAVLSAL